MEDWFEDFRKFLPKYLSADDQLGLFDELKQFPDNINSRLYTSQLRGQKSIFQGDGLCEVWVAKLPDAQIKRARVMVISNTCDVALENKRIERPRLLYCPIISFQKFESLYRNMEGATEDYLTTIRQQKVSSKFYLPANEALGEEGIVLLDHVNNCDLLSLDFEELIETRLFSLSDYGFYIFLFKISLHFTRIREGVSRGRE